MCQHSSITLLYYYAFILVLHIFIANSYCLCHDMEFIYRSRIAYIVIWVHLWQSYSLEAELANSPYKPAFPLRLFCNHPITTY